MSGSLSPQGRSSPFPCFHSQWLDHRWRMMSVPSRYAPQATGPNLVNIEVMRNRSELFRAVCSKLIAGTEKQCKGIQDGDNMRLGKKTLMRSYIGGWSCRGCRSWLSVCLSVCLSTQIRGSKTSSLWRRSWNRGWGTSWWKFRSSSPCRTEWWKGWRPAKSPWKSPTCVWRRGAFYLPHCLKK